MTETIDADLEVRVAAPSLTRFATDVFTTLGMPQADAATLADHLVWADLRGLSWLGMRKLPQYVARLRDGGTRADARPVVLEETGASVLIDARDGWGQVVGVHAMRTAVTKATSHGVGSAVVRDTTSAGALGFFAAMAADAGMVGLALNNGPALLTAPGAATPVVGNQAFALACPAGRYDPLVLDMATSAMSLVRVHEHERRGEPLPEGVALTADGQPTVDPVAALSGVLLPMAGHRGFGLSLMWEVLTGVLAGGSCISTDVGWPYEHSRPQGVSLFMLAVDPRAFMPYEQFVTRVELLVERLRASSSPGDHVRLPGERRSAVARARTEQGVPLPRDFVAELRTLGEELGVSWP